MNLIAFQNKKTQPCGFFLLGFVENALNKMYRGCFIGDAFNSVANSNNNTSMTFERIAKDLWTSWLRHKRPKDQ